MNPFSFFFLLLIAVPVVEIYFLIQVGNVIGAFSTIVLIVFTAVLGAYLFRQQGMATFQRVQATMARGEIPALEMIEGLMLMVSGALLLTPGFFTDIVGFLCLVPVLRAKLAMMVMGSQMMRSADFHRGGFSQGDDTSKFDDADIIEGEFKREDDEPEKLDKDD
ncbi:MAG: exlusion protein FxsA [Piscirickettsiaceae bacterium]|nr:MAG: exlusion protein FxsA [Piscirickettsiaceae bacterium]